MTAVLLLYKITVKSHFLGQNRLANVWGVKFKNIINTWVPEELSTGAPQGFVLSPPESGQQKGQTKSILTGNITNWHGLSRPRTCRLLRDYWKDLQSIRDISEVDVCTELNGY